MVVRQAGFPFEGPHPHSQPCLELCLVKPSSFQPSIRTFPRFKKTLAGIHFTMPGLAGFMNSRSLP